MTNKKNKSGRRSFLLGLGAFNLVAFTQECRSSNVQTGEINEYLNKETQKQEEYSLRQLAASKGLIYGGYPQREYSEFPKDLQFKDTFVRECALLVGGFFGVSIGPYEEFPTGGNPMDKGLSYEENTYNFEQPDSFFDFASKNNLIFRGHPLIWNEFNSPWLVEKFKDSNTTAAEIDRIFTNHIAIVAGRYAGKVHSWDVVNEVINVDDGRDDKLKDTTKSGVRGENYPTWLNFLGPDYIERAFRLAAEVDPKAMLVYNDNGLSYSNIYGTSWDEARRAAVLQTLESLKGKGTPIHALGIQSHLDASRNQEFDAKKFRRFLNDVATLGLKIIISELDVTDKNLPSDRVIRDRLVAETYYQYLSVALDESAVIAVISWGLSDRYTWLSDFDPREDGLPLRPLLLDPKLSRKASWWAVARAIKEAPKR